VLVVAQVVYLENQRLQRLVRLRVLG
jgi:hypothetical protein